MKNWLELIESDIVTDITQLLVTERQQYTIFPEDSEVFNAFHCTPWDDVKVVILGQDPYPTINHAHGLSFSVQPNIALPRSLVNIFTELKNDVGVARTNGNLVDWANQGVLLLNTSLTVREGSPGSHSKIGWGKFTDNVIKTLSSEKENLVFILWGRHAISKSQFIDSTKHNIITSAHPSPLSAHTGFFGSKPFSATNTYLEQHNIPAINW